MCRAASEVWQSLQDFHRMGVTIIGGASAKFMWELIEARIRATAEIEKTLNKYQSLYRLVRQRNRRRRDGRTDQNRLRNSRRTRAEPRRRQLQAGSLPATDPQKSQSQPGHHARNQGATQTRHSGSQASDFQPPPASLRQDGVDSRADELSQIVRDPIPHQDQLYGDRR